MIGITTYIKCSLCHNTEFTRRAHGSGKILSSAHGLQLGRAVDRAFTARVRGIHTAVQQTRVSAIFKCLRAAGITVTGSQSAVSAGGVRTLVDGVGVSAKGEPVVVELKCTTASMATHRELYHKPCTACPVLLSGRYSEPNTEYVRHQLQVGFAACALGWANGVVVVSCTDGVVLYHLGRGFRAQHWFSHAAAVQPRQKRAERCPAIMWPAATAVVPSPVAKISGKLAVLLNGTAAAVRVKPSALSRGQKRALALLFTGQKGPYFVIYPASSTWHVAHVKWLGVNSQSL